jgi:serralysin
MAIDPTNLAGTATLSFNEDFNNLDLWNGSSGRWATNFWWADPYGAGSTLPQNAEQQWYINSMYGPTQSVKPWTVTNGILTIAAAKSDPSIQGLINGFQYTSGELNTFHSFSQTYGYFEMRAELPSGQGPWSAFWMLPATGITPPPELDVMEVLGRNSGAVETAMHSADGTRGGTLNVASTTDGFHNYGVDWEADRITWYFDGRVIDSMATPSDMHQAMYLVADLALGGPWAGNVDGSTPIPAQLKIDYIRAYTQGAPNNTPPAPPQPNPQPSGTPQVLVSPYPGATLVGSSGADTLIASQGSDQLTGGAGADSFVFKALPWNAGHITDFQVGVDKLDISALYANGYSGSDPVADGYITFVSNGAGGTKVLLDTDGAAGGNTLKYIITTLDGISPGGLTAANVFGAASPGASGSGGGQVLTSGYPGATLVGSSGADTLIASQGSDQLTGGAGADSFVFKALPWSAGHITDFQVGVDKLDLRSIFAAAGYGGSEPTGDGTLAFVSDGLGDTRVMFHAPGASWSTLISTLDHVEATNLRSSDLLFH